MQDQFGQSHRGRAAIQTGISVLGCLLITKKEQEIAAFKTPDLRNLLPTPPYFRGGLQETLWSSWTTTTKGDGVHNSYLDEDVRPLALSEADLDDVVAFLASLPSADYHDPGIN